MSNAMLVSNGSRPSIRLERHLSDPPEVVWRALTEREQLRNWFPCDVIVAGGEWSVGAAISFPFPADAIDLTLTGEVLEVDRPHRLAFSWGEDLLLFELTAQGSGTDLVLVDDLPAGSAARNAAGWDSCLDRLTGQTVPDGTWKQRFAVYTDAFAPRLGPQEGPPSGYTGKELD
jgi:uncharacterized protein YndB with AHSA1/START domain